MSRERGPCEASKGTARAESQRATEAHSSCDQQKNTKTQRPSRAADDHNDDVDEDEWHPKPNHCNGFAYSEVPRLKLCVT